MVKVRDIQNVADNNFAQFFCQRVDDNFSKWNLRGVFDALSHVIGDFIVTQSEGKYENDRGCFGQVKKGFDEFNGTGVSPMHVIDYQDQRRLFRCSHQ